MIFGINKFKLTFAAIGLVIAILGNLYTNLSEKSALEYLEENIMKSDILVTSYNAINNGLYLDSLSYPEFYDFLRKLDRSSKFGSESSKAKKDYDITFYLSIYIGDEDIASIKLYKDFNRTNVYVKGSIDHRTVSLFAFDTTDVINVIYNELLDK